MEATNANIKRPLSEKSSETHGDQPQKKPTMKAPTSAKKKQKTEVTEKTIEEILKPVKHILNKPNKVLNYTQFKSLMENTQGSPNPKEIVLEYTKDTNALIALMKNDIYPYLTDRSIKNRLTRLTNKLGKTTTESETPIETPNNSDDDTE